MKVAKKNCAKKRGRPVEPGSLASTAKRLSVALGIRVTSRMVEVWKRKGYDLKSPRKLTESLLNQERVPKGLKRKTAKKRGKPAQPKPPAGLELSKVESELAELQKKLVEATDYETARTLRTQIAGIRDVLKELREQGRYILRDDAIAAGARAGLASRAAWEKIEDALPPMLEGLTALQMKSKLRDYARGVSLELASVFQDAGGG